MKRVLVTGGTSGIDKHAALHVYPNPNNGSFTINLETVDPQAGFELFVMNMAGQVLYNTREFSPVVQVDERQLPSGMYFVVCKNGAETFTEKLMIE